MKTIFVRTLSIILVVLSISFCVGCEAPEVTTREYEVLSVYQYPRTKTNGYGGITGYDVGYHVSYIDDNGNVGEEDFVNQSEWDNPNTLVTVGEETKLIISDNGKITLYLTREDFDNMQVKTDENSK